MRLILAAVIAFAPAVVGSQSRLQAYADSLDRAARPTPGTLFEFEVERPVKPLGRQPAALYPEALRAANIEGSVMARFEVDTAGLVDTATFTVVRSTHPDFSQAIREVLSQLRYQPAENKGHLVRQVVMQRFEFALRR